MLKNVKKNIKMKLTIVYFVFIYNFATLKFAYYWNLTVVDLESTPIGKVLLT